MVLIFDRRVQQTRAAQIRPNARFGAGDGDEYASFARKHLADILLVCYEAKTH